MRYDVLLRIFPALVASMICLNTEAQTIKAGVLVVGASSGGYAAAIQSAHSGVKTILLDTARLTEPEVSTREALAGSGVFNAFVKRIEGVQRFSQRLDQPISREFALTIFKAWTDTVANLKVLRGRNIVQLEREGKTWRVILSDQGQVKCDALVDATENASVLIKSGGKYYTDSNQLNPVAYGDLRYRTSVAILPRVGIHPPVLPLKALTTSKENFFVTGNQEVGFSMSQGQAAGAAAAFCSFFKSRETKLNVRAIQNELINYGSDIFRFQDVALQDSNGLAIQTIGLTGILRGKKRGTVFCFMPDSAVSFDEIRDPVKEYYSRSQIWFLDNKGKNMSIGDLVSLIKFVAYRGKELDRELERGWVKSLKLSGRYDPGRGITRREFAVLVNSYMQPFKVNIDLSGRLKR